jgi:flagellar protein FlgJ
VITGIATATAAAAGHAPDPRLRSAAHEFEACLMKEILQPLQHDALFEDDAGGESGSGSGNALTSFGSEALAKAISERGGFGIAQKIIGHFEGENGAQTQLPQTILRKGEKT